MVDAPIDGQLVVLTAAKASVTLDHLQRILPTVDEYLRDHAAEYERDYERAIRTDRFDAYFVEEGHWASIGTALGFEERETDGARRAHEQQLRRTGRSRGRSEAFESALEIREVVLVGRED